MKAKTGGRGQCWALANVFMIVQREMRRVVALLAVLVLPSCMDMDFSGPSSLFHIPPQDCAALPSTTWDLNGYDSGADLQVAVGESRQVNLTPLIEPHCADTITSVAWGIEHSAMASIIPNDAVIPGHAFVTGLSPGLTMVNARISFSDGTERESRGQPVSVVPSEPPPPGSHVVAEGSLDFEGLPPNTVISRCVAVTIQEAGRVYVVVDWISPLNRVFFGLYEGSPSSSGWCGGTVVVNGGPPGVKPQRGEGTVEAGEYALSVSSGNETIHYEVRLTPD